jgi:CRP/FNR family transcriptional regulator, cyclic AMP receptor protein
MSANVTPVTPVESRPPASAPEPGTVSLLRADAGLREAVPAAELPFAQRVVIGARHQVGPGPWSPADLLPGSTDPFAAIVISGVVTHEVALAGRCSADLLGSGDVLRPWRAVDSALPAESLWSSPAGAEIAVLDQRFLAATRRWPRLGAVIHERLADQLDASAARAAIVALPRVEERVLALFWQLADRWGVVTADAVVVRLPLTHAFIGQLVGAQRPTVSLALHALAQEPALLSRTAPGAWSLSHRSNERLAPDAVPGSAAPQRHGRHGAERSTEPAGVA